MNRNLRIALLHGGSALLILGAASCDLKPLDDLGKTIFRDPELSTLARRNRRGTPLLTTESLREQVLREKIPSLEFEIRPPQRER